MIKMMLLWAALIVLLEGVPLFRQKKWSELITIGAIIGIGFMIGFGQAWGIPAPVETVTRWLFPVGKAIFKHF